MAPLRGNGFMQSFPAKLALAYASSHEQSQPCHIVTTFLARERRAVKGNHISAENGKGQ